MRILVTGYNGQLGYDVIKRLNVLGIECRGVDIDDFDLTDAAAVSRYIAGYQPAAVIHCAAYTAVDKAEDNPELCHRVNVTGTENIARSCRAIGAKMVYISTDYVFGGAGETAYEVDTPKAPQSQYGLSKSQGEDVICQLLEQYFIIRTSWVFGINGGNFIKTMIRLGGERPEVTVVCDQIGSPTYTVDLAVLICDMVQSERYGVYHATNEGYCSWYEFATAIMAEAGLKATVKPVTSDQYPAKAARPKNSRLSKVKLDQAGFARLPHWQDALHRYIKEIISASPQP